MKTRASELLGIQHPVVLGGMGGGTSVELVAAVSNSGGLGVKGCVGDPPAEIARLAETIRGATDKPFGLNLLLFQANAEAIEAVIAARPAVLSTAWPATDQDLAAIFSSSARERPQSHAHGLDGPRSQARR